MIFESSSFLEVWHQLLAFKLNPEELVEAAVTAKLIWERRNKFVHQAEFTHTNSIVTKARNEVISYKEATDQISSSNTSNPPNMVQWSAPPPGIYKDNWDAATNSKDGKAGI